MSILNRYWRSFRNGPWWRYRYVFLCIVMALGTVAVLLLSRSAANDEDVRPLSEIVALAEAGSVEKIEVTAGKLIVTLRHNDYSDMAPEVVSYTGETTSLVDVATLLEDEGIEIGGPEGVELLVPKPTLSQNPVVVLFIGLAPIFLFMGFFYWIMSRQMRDLNSKIDITTLPKVTFDDVGGLR